MGLTSFITEPAFSLPYNQRDTCTVLESINEVKNKLSANHTNNANYTKWYDQLMQNIGQRTLISKY